MSRDDDFSKSGNSHSGQHSGQRVGQVKEVTSLTNPIVKDLRSLALKKFRDQQGVFLAEGLKLVIDAFEQDWRIKTLVFAKSGKGNKPTGWSGTWSGTAHYNQSVFREMLLEYKRTGFMPTFDIQVANEDPTASVGRQTIILKNCLTKGGILAKFDADAETLDEELEGTFDDWEMPETFSLLNGMQ